MTTQTATKTGSITDVYEIRTTQVLTHSHGIAWTADLVHKPSGRVIGVVEQEGRGGCDSVYVDTREDRDTWRDACSFLPGGEEHATYLLLCAEEGTTPEDIY